MEQLKVIMLGTGSPRPSLERSASAYLLYIDQEPILIDCGDNTTTQLLKVGVDLPEIKTLFLTHLHSDHTFGYGQFLIGGWAWGRRELTVIGPKGTKEFHENYLKLFKKDIEYRLNLGRPENGIYDVNIIEIDEPGPIPCDSRYKVYAESMVHSFPTFAYKFEVANKNVVFSGDTSSTKDLIHFSKGADLIVHDSALAETEFRHDPGFKQIWEGLLRNKDHCTPAQAAETAKKAEAKKLALTHFLPGVNEEQVYHEAAKHFSGEIIVGRDLLTIDVS